MPHRAKSDCALASTTARLAAALLLAGSAMSASAAKAALRDRMRATLKALPAATVHRDSIRVWARAVAIPEFVLSGSVSIYCNMPQGEVQTSNLIRSLFAEGKAVYVPRVDGPGRDEMRMLRVESLNQFGEFPLSKWGIPEPTAEAAALMADATEAPDLTVLLVPAVAFDTRCGRLGHGRGYYDSFISTQRRREKRMRHNLGGQREIAAEKKNSTLTEISLLESLSPSPDVIPLSMRSLSQ